MAIGPIDYTLNVQQPFEAATKGIALGQAISAAQDAAVQRKRQSILLEQMNALAKNPNRTAEDVFRVAAFLPKDQSEALTNAYKAKTQEQQTQDLSFGGQVLANLNAGRSDLAYDALMKKAEAAKASGLPQADQWSNMANLIKGLPADQAFTSTAIYMANIPGGKDIVTNVLAAQKSPVELSKARSEAKIKQSEADFADAMNQAGVNEKYWNTQNTISTINDRTARLGLDAKQINATVAKSLADAEATLSGIGKPSEATIKGVNDAAVNSSIAGQLSANMDDLASRLEGLGGGYGTFSNIGEFFDRSLGGQDKVTALRDEYSRLKNSAVSRSLPAGSASDRDIQIFSQGWPPEGADAAYTASFLRGMAKVARIEQVTEQAKSDWLLNNRGVLSPASKEMQIENFVVKRGEKFSDFSMRISKEMNDRFRAAQALREQGASPETIRLVETVSPDALQAILNRNKYPVANNGNTR